MTLNTLDEGSHTRSAWKKVSNFHITASIGTPKYGHLVYVYHSNCQDGYIDNTVLKYEVGMKQY